MSRLPILASLLGAACAAREVPNRVPLYENLGSFHVPISSSSREAQAYFDQGMRLTYAFNHVEAIRAFEEAARRDPGCAICYWGVALASGPNINWPMDSASGARAWAAIERARELADRANERERALIAALAARYAVPPPAARGSLDSAYAREMGQLAARYPDDREVLTLHAEALMVLTPWDYWDRAGKPRRGTELILGNLERVIAADSLHPGACHFYIHAVEAVEPARGVPCAERLAATMPGAGHLVHMPAHIYVRVGRYAEAIEHNRHAVHADSSFAAVERPSMVYAAMYVPHNHHFLSFAALLAGQAELAIEASRATVRTVPAEVMKGLPEFQPIMVHDQLTLAKFGRWQDVLASPRPGPDFPVALAAADYARGAAFAATAQGDSARAALDRIAGQAASMPAGLARSIVEIARHSLAGEIAFRRNRLTEAEQHLRTAMAIEDELMYMEPPWWIEPVRHALGAVLLRAGQPREAERVYREDLARFPRNCWSLHGLAESLKAQGRAEAREAEGEFRESCGEIGLTTSHL